VSHSGTLGDDYYIYLSRRESHSSKSCNPVSSHRKPSTDGSERYLQLTCFQVLSSHGGTPATPMLSLSFPGMRERERAGLPIMLQRERVRLCVFGGWFKQPHLALAD